MVLGSKGTSHMSKPFACYATAIVKVTTQIVVETIARIAIGTIIAARDVRRSFVRSLSSN